MINPKLKRTLPFLRLLRQASNNTQKHKMLKAFPGFVVDDMVEILYNILYQNVSVRNPRHKAVLMTRKRPLTSIVRAYKQKNKRKILLRKQSGGFIGAIVPILTSVLGGLLSSAVA